ncbi:MAG: HAD family phosphatase [Christensenellaceae bacterium]|nr:HAD family phosphatase [Christensenellaceae bacterium]
MIKLVISDIDGTLVDRTEVLKEPAFALADWLKKRGIMFSLATGRVQGMAENYAKSLNINIPYITANGAALIKDGKAIIRHTVSLSILKNIIIESDKLGLSIIYSPNGYEKVHKLTPFIISQQKKFNRYFDVYAIDEKEFCNGFVEKLCIMDDDYTGIINNIEEIAKELPTNCKYTRYGDRAIEIVGGNSTKASGIQELAKYLGLSMNEIMAIGDDENDIEMLSEVGIGATVQNALDKVKASVDYVASKSHADGVFEAVYYFLNGGN